MKKIPFFAMLLSLIIPVMFINAQEESQPLVLVYNSPARPVAGSLWILTLLIDHSDPNEVEVLAPPFTGALFLDQLIKGPRFYDPGTGQTFNRLNIQDDEPVYEQWTVMEYRFLLNNPGTVYLDSFTVITPKGQVKTVPFSKVVQRPQNTQETQLYRLVWEGLPQRLEIGENAFFSLNITDWNRNDYLPGIDLLMPPVPQGHILESQPLSAEDNETGKVLRLRIIPLEAVPFVLDKRQFSYNMNAFEVPAVRIPVYTAADNKLKNEKAAGIPVTAVTDTEAQVSGSQSLLRFPSMAAAIGSHPGLYDKYREECNTVYGTAKNLWERGYYADSLTTLRQNEKNHRAGALFAIIRREAEQLLGFTETNDEKTRFFGQLFGEKYRSALVRETVVRRIPDSAGEEIAVFRNGQPVLVADTGTGGAAGRNAVWRRIIANDKSGISGWITEQNIIYY